MINKRQEKELADLIDGSAFEKSEFDVYDARSTPKSQVYKSIHLKGRPYYFHIKEGIEIMGGNYVLEFSPNDIGMLKKFDGANWDTVLKFFVFWLKNLKEELEVKDIWSNVANNKSIFEFGELNNENEKFSNEEIELIDARIEIVKQKIQMEKSIPENKKEQLIRSFEYFKKKAREHTKIDWKNIIVGTIVGLVLNEENLRFVVGLLLYIVTNPNSLTK